jgi:hypothetical protein
MNLTNHPRPGAAPLIEEREEAQSLDEASAQCGEREAAHPGP